MKSNFLIRVFGWRAGLVHGDTTTLDRWRWLSHRLPRVSQDKSLIDIGCGSGAFTIGVAKRGYLALGISYDKRNQDIAAHRAALSGVTNALFEIGDVRQLHSRPEYAESFDVAILCEVIEHILNDDKLVRDAARCLKPGGMLLLTTPNLDYVPITKEDAGPFLTEETGWHVRKGYDAERLKTLARSAGLEVEEISFCSGFLSQKITGIYRVLQRVNTVLAWTLILPLRPFPPLLDGIVSRLLKWPDFSICLQARKPQ